MSEAAGKRLWEIVTDQPKKSDPNVNSRTRKAHAHLHFELAEGWFSLFLLTIIIYTTVWAVQAAGWGISHLDLLSLTAVIGLFLGVIAAKQRFFSRALVYGLVITVGIVLALWQTAAIFYNGNMWGVVQGGARWLALMSAGTTVNDQSIFLFLLIALCFILAVMSTWLVYSLHNPWLMIIANAVVLLINLNDLDNSSILFMIMFLVASLLLILNLNFYELVTLWHKQGLRYGDDLRWSIIQAGSFISVGLLVFAWILPDGYINGPASQLWSSSNNPLMQVQNTLDRILAINGGINLAGHGNFRDSLVLAGNPNLNNDVVLTLSTNATNDSADYLALVSYQTYNNGGWAIHTTSSYDLKANQSLQPSAILTHPVKQKITIVNPPGEQNAYLPGLPEVDSINVPSRVQFGSGGTVAWVSTNGNLAAGTSYTVTSLTSIADATTLRTIPMPQDSTQYSLGGTTANSSIPIDAFNTELLHDFTQWPQSVNENRIAALAQSIIKNAHATTMYDKATALEEYLRESYSYNVDIHPAPGEDPVTWFLFDNSQRAGFCNYFSASMALLARSLNIPARVVAGYAPGTFDEKHNQYIVRGKEAHSWTQIYFAGYGWINFEPSASFNTFTRPSGQSTESGVGSSGTILPTGIVPPGTTGKNRLTPPDHINPTSSDSTVTTSASGQSSLQQSLVVVPGLLILLLLFAALLLGIWWRRLFRNYSLSTQLYGRICVLAFWAGKKIQPSQTPYEYLQSLSSILPTESDAMALQRLGDIYVREHWAAPGSPDHPVHSGEIAELPGLWKRLQPRIVLYTLSHPHFLRWLPERTHDIVHTWQQRRQRKHSTRTLSGFER